MDPVEQGARAAARRLEEQHGEQVIPGVEAALQEREAVEHRLADPVSLGGLIVSIATLAWTVYRDLKEDQKAKPPMAVVIRAVRRQLDWEGDVDTSEQAELIETTVEATVEAAERQEN